MIKLSLFVLLGSGLSVVAQSSGTFVLTGSTTFPRAYHTATLLKDGRVLVTGAYSSAELYDPSSGTFTPTGAMATTRVYHTGTLLNDGRVLIAGGSDGRSPSAELYDPVAGTFTPTGDMVNPGQFRHSAFLLGNGKVLIVGGIFRGVPNSTGSYQVMPALSEFYDPVTATFSPAGEVNGNIFGSTTTLLNNGRVLLVGSFAGHSATLLTNGTVLIAGGWSSNDDYETQSLDTAQIYDPSVGSFKPTGSLVEARDNHTATLLPGGLVLVAGGENSDRVLASAELYDPATRTFLRTGTMNVTRLHHTATLLRDGRVLIVGGGLTFDTTAELYIPPLRAVSAASLSGPLAPGSLGSLFGSRLAATTESTDPLSPSTILGGISLRLVDSSGVSRLVPLLYVSPSQINFEVPAGTATGNVTLEVVNAPGVSKTTAQVNPTAPGLFAYQDNSPVAYALRFEPSGKQTVLSVQNTIVLDDRPVYLIAYATGIRNRSSLANVTSTIGGISVPVEYAGPEGSGVPGLDQVNLRLTPDLKGIGVASLVLTADGVSSNTVSVDVR